MRSKLAILLLTCLPAFAASPWFYFPTTNEMIAAKIVAPATNITAYLGGYTNLNIGGGPFYYITNTSPRAIDWVNVFPTSAGASSRWHRASIPIGTNGLGPVTIQNLEASKPVFTDANKTLVSTGILGVDQGGFGLSWSGASEGSIPYFDNSDDVWTALSPNSTATKKYLSMTSDVPSWSTINLSAGSSDITGTLPLLRGGLGADFSATVTGSFPYIDSGVGVALSPNTTGTQKFLAMTSSTPSWVASVSSVPVPVAEGGTSGTTFTKGILVSPGGTNTFTTIAGTTGYFPYWSSSYPTTTSPLWADATKVGLGKTTPMQLFNVVDGGNLLLDAGYLETSFGGIGRYSNYLPYSEDFTQWGFINLTATANNTTAPDGNVTADRINVTSLGGYMRLRVSGDADTRTFTISSWMKTVSGAKTVTIGMVDENDNGLGAAAVAVTAVWQRFQHTVTVAATTTSFGMYFQSNVDTNQWYVWGAQMEEAAGPGVYTQTIGFNQPTAQLGANINGTTKLIGGLSVGTNSTPGVGNLIVSGSAVAGSATINGTAAINGAATFGSVMTVTGAITNLNLAASLPVKTTAGSALTTGAINLGAGSTERTGVLPSVAGGTGTDTYLEGTILTGASGNALVKLPPGTTGYVLTRTATTNIWAAASAGTPADFTASTGLTVTGGTNVGALNTAMTLAVNTNATFVWTGIHYWEGLLTNSTMSAWYVTGDASQRLQFLADGRMRWGDGGGTLDVGFMRRSAGVMGLTGLYVTNNVTVAGALAVTGAATFTTLNSLGYVSATGAGTLTVAQTQNKNTVFAGSATSDGTVPVFRALTVSDMPGTGSGTGTGQTTDGTTFVTVYSFTPADGTSVTIRAYLAARRTDSGAGQGTFLFGNAFRSGGTVTVNYNNVSEAGGFANAEEINVSGTTVRIQVKGIDMITIDWRADVFNTVIP